MITVFDVATEEELTKYFGSNIQRIKNNDSDDNYGDLAFLYAGRGDMENSNKYHALIEDEQSRLDNGRIIAQMLARKRFHESVD
jgi:hypothetical protein